MEWSSMPELEDVVKLVKKAFPEKFAHIDPKKILYACYSKKQSRSKARIVSISPRYSIFLPGFVYVLEIHKESWESDDEGNRLYTIMHELLHIPDGGFTPDDKKFKRLARHNIEDFRALVRDYGVDLENIEKLTKKIKDAEKK